MHPDRCRFTQAHSSSHQHGLRRSRIPAPRVLFALSFAAMAACSDRDAPTAVAREPQRPTLTVVGADYVVTTTANSGAGSLRQAILDADTASVAKTIGFDIPSSDAGCSAGVCTITLASTLPTFTSGAGITVDGTGQSIAVSGNGAVRVMDIAAGATVTLRRLTITRGFINAILCSASQGAGGGICNAGTLVVIETTFSLNVALGAGGAIANRGAMTVEGSTFSGNQAPAGGGIDNSSLLDAFITNTTFSGNSALSGGSAIATRARQQVTITNSTFSGNSSSGFVGGTLRVDNGTVTLRNSIVAIGAAGPNCVLVGSTGRITDGGGNLSFGDATCPGGNGDPKLGPLQVNGPGLTATHALLAGSAAIGAAVAANCPGTDQRGVSRPYLCDTGAYESALGPTDVTAPVITPSIVGTLGSNGWYTSDVTVSWSVSDPDSPVTSAPCAPTTITADTPSQDVVCSATSDGGQANTIVLIKRDATAPTITFGNVDPAPNAAGWNNTSVMVSWSCSDATSAEANFSVTQPIATEGQNQSVTGQCADNAGNTAQDTRSGINIDTTVPTLAPVVAPNPVALNGTATATPNASDAGSGLASSSCPTPSTASAGSKTVQCTATDKAGNSATASAAYSVEIPDATPPTITPNIAGTVGASGWFRSDVSISWSVGDAESPVTSQTGCGTTSITEDTQGQTLTCTAISTGGTATRSVTIKRDVTAPTMTFASATPAPNAAGWNRTPVTVGWTCTDGTAGVPSSSVTQTVNTDGQNQSATGQCTDNAGNAAQNTRSGINIDKVAPTLAPVVSPNPVLLNGSATATPNATDALAGLVSATCGTPVTTAVGSKSVSCTAVDQAGNTNTVAANYLVTYPFTDFLQPVDPMPTVNVVKAGSGVQVKFGLGGNQGLAIFAAGFPASQQVSCDASAPQDDIEATVTAGNSSLAYDASTQQYSYTWKTDKAWAGTCRVLSITLVDGTTHQASFKLK